MLTRRYLVSGQDPNRVRVRVVRERRARASPARSGQGPCGHISGWRDETERSLNTRVCIWMCVASPPKVATDSKWDWEFPGTGSVNKALTDTL